MRNVLLLCCLLVAVLRTASADTAADVAPLADEAGLAKLAAYKIELSAQQRELIQRFLREPAATENPQREALKKDLTDGDVVVRLEGLFYLASSEAGFEVLSKLRDHTDPLLRFIANLQPTMHGDAKAAQALYDLIHSSEPTLLQKQLIQGLLPWNWTSSGVGLRGSHSGNVAESGVGRGEIETGQPGPRF